MRHTVVQEDKIRVARIVNSDLASTFSILSLVLVRDLDLRQVVGASLEHGAVVGSSILYVVHHVLLAGALASHLSGLFDNLVGLLLSLGAGSPAMMVNLTGGARDLILEESVQEDKLVLVSYWGQIIG